MTTETKTTLVPPPTFTITTADADTELPFTALAWVEGRWTGDGRFVMTDAISWEGILPMPLTVNHAGVETVIGRVDELARTPGATGDERFVMARGVLDTATALGPDMETLIRSRYVRGVSMELDAVVEGGIDPDTADADMPAGSGGWVMVTESGRVRALSVVTTGAFAEAFIAFDDDMPDEATPPKIDGPEPVARGDMPQDDPDDVIIVAAAHTIVMPQVPPADWFLEPEMIDGGLTITDEGRVYGWLAPANVPYSGLVNNFTVPMGNVNYSRWQNRVTVVDDGSRVMTGNLTMGCGHGDTHTTDHQAVRDHYDNSCSLFARLASGENAHGVWIAGALYPGVTGEQIARAMGLQCSGHWIPSTESGYTYDLEAVLLVPVPGFNASRRSPSLTMRDGVLAASAVPVQFEDCGCGEDVHQSIAAAADFEHMQRQIVDLARRCARLERVEMPALVASLRERITTSATE